METANENLIKGVIKKQVYGEVAELLYEMHLLTSEEKIRMKNMIEREECR